MAPPRASREPYPARRFQLSNCLVFGFWVRTPFLDSVREPNTTVLSQRSTLNLYLHATNRGTKPFTLLVSASLKRLRRSAAEGASMDEGVARSQHASCHNVASRPSRYKIGTVLKIKN